jgi:LuxR family transcriptional regulator, maltose regulon positive regulatory protein
VAGGEGMTAAIDGFPPLEPALQPGDTATPSFSVVGAVVARYELFSRLDKARRATVVSAPAGSGKTFLLRSWIDRAHMRRLAAWVPVPAGERDPQRFWIAVADALRGTAPASGLVRPLTAAPDLDGWAIVERLLKDLARLADPVWLVIDDVHELASAEVLRQLELLVLRAPERLRFVLAARHDLPLGLHRLRLEGELTEIRAADLLLTLAEARALFEGAGVTLPDTALALLHARSEGWAAGLRLAALSLAGHPDPERFAAEFSGSERTVAEYLVAEVLNRQSEPVRRLLLRTSVLERVCGEIADLLTGGSGGERVLQDLEEANAFVVSLDAARSWFRYHHLFADLLQLELRRTAPAEVPRLHLAAAEWFAGHGFPVEAIRHAQAAQDWGLAAQLLADHWPVLYLDGQAATVHALLTGFPAETRTADAELAAVTAADELAQGSLGAAERYLALAEQELASAPPVRRGPALALLGVVRLLLAWFKGDWPMVVQQAHRLQALSDAPEAAQSGRGELRALALIGLSDTEMWTGRLDQAELHLDQAVRLARRIGRPYLEFMALVYQAEIELSRWFPQAAERSRQAIDLAERHGWTDETTAGLAYNTLGSALAWQGRLEEAAGWMQRAERTIRPEAAPSSAMGNQFARGQVELARGQSADALTAFRAAERLAGGLASPQPLVRPMKVWLLHTLSRLGDFAAAEQLLSGLSERDRDRGEMRIGVAVLRLAQDDLQRAAAELAPVLDGSARVGWQSWLVEAFLLEAIAQDAVGHEASADRALERALDLAEPDGALLWFLLHPAPVLLERHARRAPGRGALITHILSLLRDASLPPMRSARTGPSEPRLRDSLSQAELRVLRYLPTSLSVAEIAGQLYLSVNTVRTHMRHLYDKLDVHRRHEAVERARALGLLAPAMHPSGSLPGGFDDRFAPREGSGR